MRGVEFREGGGALVRGYWPDPLDRVCSGFAGGSDGVRDFFVSSSDDIYLPPKLIAPRVASVVVSGRVDRSI
jgi:hypothetical protein